MWEYTDKVRDYYRDPKHVGMIEDANAVAEVGSLSCGDALKIYLKIDENGIIQDAKFQTFGCGSAVASAGALIDLIIGKNIEDAIKISNQDIADYLGGLPEQKLHCSVMGQEALEAAYANYKGLEYVAHEEEDPIVCKCFGVPASKIKSLVKEHNVDSIQGVTNLCKAGGGCGMCRDDIQKIIDAELGVKMDKPEVKPMTKTQMIIKVNNVLENIIATELRKDNGDIELVDIDGNKIYVKLTGSCKSCPSSNLTLKNFVERTLKEHINEDIEVIEA